MPPTDHRGAADRDQQASRFAQLDRLFQHASALPLERRTPWLETQLDPPAVDRALIDEVEALLAHDSDDIAAGLEGIVDAGWHDLSASSDRPSASASPGASPGASASASASTPLSDSIHETVGELSADRQDEPDPERIGPYRVRRRLGRGGLATVYLAEREGEFSMPVAIKRIRRGMDTDDIIARLRLERQILARLVHPNIARIHDGGSDEQGRPYLVMEVIEGERIDRWCTARRLPARQRLDLFLQASEAVEFAHQSLVLHRDLKPSNILVTDEGTVKLLDFGIAKLLTGDRVAPADGNPRDSAQLTVTAIENRLLTPAYASPEQLLGQPLTTASDVYSLGIMLFVLLTGRLPDADDRDAELRRWTGQRADPPALGRTLRQQRRDGNDTTAPADRWLDRAEDEIDAVIAKAMAGEPSQRYGSVRQLADDIQRLLDDRPVLARRPSWRLRMLKLARRHRVAVAATLLIILSMLAAVIGTSWQAAVASAERQRAERQQAQAEAVADFLVELFEVSDPYAQAELLGVADQPAQQRGQTVTARELLDAAARRIDGSLGGDRMRQSRLRRAIARAYSNLSLFDQAREQLQAVEEDLSGWNAKLQTADAARARAHALVTRDLARIDLRQGRFDAADHGLQRAEAALLEQGGSVTNELALTLEYRGDLEHARGDPAAAQSSFQAALEHYQQLHGKRSLPVARAEAGIAKALQLDHQPAAAAVRFEGVLELRRELLGANHPLVLETLNDLALVSTGARDWLAGRRVFEDLLQRQIEVLGADHIDLIPTYYNLATTLDKLGQSAEAEARLAEAWRLAGPPAAATPIAAKVLMLRGLQRERFDDIVGASEIYRQAIELRRQLLGSRHVDTANAVLRLGRLLASNGDPSAKPLLLEALATSTELQLGHEPIIHLALGELALATDQPKVAEAELSRGLALAGDQGSWLVGILEQRRAEALASLGRAEEARQSANRAVELLTASLGPEHAWTVEAKGLLAGL